MKIWKEEGLEGRELEHGEIGFLKMVEEEWTDEKNGGMEERRDM